MKITTQLRNDLPKEEMIGKNIFKNKKVVGKILEYNSKTGIAEIDLDGDFDDYFENAGEHIGISSRKNN